MSPFPPESVFVAAEARGILEPSPVPTGFPELLAVVRLLRSPEQMGPPSEGRPETAIRWHRKGLRPDWCSGSPTRCGRPGLDA